MSERTEEELYGFLYKMEEWAWKSLRDDGYSESDIWSWVADATYEAPTADEEKRHYCALLILETNVLYEKLGDDSFSQSAVDWARDGWLIGSLRALAGITDYDRKVFSKIQAGYAKKSRKKSLLPTNVIRFVLQQAPPGEATYIFFRHYIGGERRLSVNDCEIEITAVDAENGQVGLYVFENTNTGQKIVRKQSSVRSTIHRLKISNR